MRWLSAASIVGTLCGEMPPPPGTLVLMGSGETTPTMVTLHQRLAEEAAARLDRERLDAAILDTPYGFQENAAEITGKAQRYFAHHVGLQVHPVGAARLADAPGVDVEAALVAVRQADWLFAGPGSPTYAAMQWGSGPFADAFTEVVRRGGVLVLASAAAATAGDRTLPVYEVYKAGAEPRWRDGLGLVRALLGWPAVVVPHFDNAEGGTHDTRFCYMGERRLTALEADLDADQWVLGIDEHTAAVLDLHDGTMAVHGRGGVHLRRGGRLQASWPDGTTVPLEEVTAAAHVGTSEEGLGNHRATGADPGSVRRSALPEEVDVLVGRFDDAVDGGDARTATAAALDVEAAIRSGRLGAEVSEDVGRAIAALRAMITRLGSLAAQGMHDHTELVRPLIESMLHVREHARARQAFEVADHIRDHMDADGIQVRDTRHGTVWEWEEPPLPRSG